MIVCLLIALATQSPAASPAEPAARESVQPPPLPSTHRGRPLSDDGRLVLASAVDGDARSRELWVQSELVLREGVLEMLACRRNTKEHESIVAIDAPAVLLNASLLAMGLEAGKPVQFDPEFRPPQGPRLEITLHWTDPDTKQPVARRSQDVIRRAVNKWHGASLPQSIVDGISLPAETMQVRYVEFDEMLIFFGQMTDEELAELRRLSDDTTWTAAIEELKAAGVMEPMAAEWVYTGSRWSRLPDGTEEYDATSGNYVCVANFADAIIDIDRRSSNSNGQLLYEPWAERLPPLGTPVWLQFRRASNRQRPAGAEPAVGDDATVQPPSGNETSAPKPLGE